jgi:hypothetical protein
MNPSIFGNGYSTLEHTQQTEQEIWNGHAHLSQEQEFWQQTTSDLASNAFANPNALMAQQTPRSLPASHMTYPVWISIRYTISILTPTRQRTMHPCIKLSVLLR